MFAPSKRGSTGQDESWVDEMDVIREENQQMVQTFEEGLVKLETRTSDFEHSNSKI